MSAIPDTAERSRAILDSWFATIDDATPLDREAEPFGSCFARWYGKRPEIDAEIRARFEPALAAVTEHGRDWDRHLEAWRRQPDGLVALTILLDARREPDLPAGDGRAVRGAGRARALA